MTLPEGAVLETMLAGGVALYDVSHLLPTGPRRYGTRNPDAIVRAYFHHSGADGRPGYDGPYRSTRYVVENRDFRGAAYHFWFPYEECKDSEGNLIVFRLNNDETRSYHTGLKANTHGIGCCFQGNLSNKPMSANQEELAEAFVPWILENYPLELDNTPLSFHAEASKFGGKSKPTCPGPHVTKWITDYRDGM